jgi:hypothetical protein
MESKQEQESKSTEKLKEKDKKEKDKKKDKQTVEGEMKAKQGQEPPETLRGTKDWTSGQRENLTKENKGF